MLAWTSTKAYHEIRLGLPEARRRVLDQIIFYIRTRHEPPTGSELVEFSGLAGAWKRLSELERAGCAHRGAARKCTVTGRTARTWRPGPANQERGLFDE